MRYTKMRKMIRQMAAGALTAFLLTGLAGCGAAGPVGEEETDEQETGSSADVGEQGVSEANWDKTAFEINGEPVSLREWNFYLRMNQMQWEKQYLEDYGDDMWSVETDDSGATMADGLKKEVMEVIGLSACLKINILINTPRIVVMIASTKIKCSPVKGKGSRFHTFSWFIK